MQAQFQAKPSHQRWLNCRRVRMCRACRPTASSETPQTTMTGSCYEEVVEKLAQRAITAMKQQPPGRKHIVGIAGAPGSGKSTLAAAVMHHINTVAGKDVAVLLPMDGFHYYKRELDQMPDPQAAYARRGAHWTFNAPAFIACVQRVRQQGTTSIPSFNHGIGDPVEDDITITNEHRIVLVEGNYVLLDEEPWHSLKQYFDDTWFVDVDIDVAMGRVYARQTGLGIAPEVSKRRIESNDRPNGELVNASSKRHAAVLVPSSIPFSSSSSSVSTSSSPSSIDI